VGRENKSLTADAGALEAPAFYFHRLRTNCPLAAFPSKVGELSEDGRMESARWQLLVIRGAEGLARNGQIGNADFSDDI
jgi:hypothetical protein